MTDKTNVLEMTKREQDIMEIMIEATKAVLGCDEMKRTCLSPSAIRDMLMEKYPGIKVFHVTSSRDNLEHLGLITRILEAGCGEPISGARNPLTFEVNNDLYRNSEVRIIQKRKTGYLVGTNKKPPVTIDKTKTTIKRAKELVIKIKARIVLQEKESLAARRKLNSLDERIRSDREEVQIIADLLAIKRRNLKKLGLLID